MKDIKFVTHKCASHRRHYINEEDIKVLLSRLPEELFSRLKKIHFKDDARGNRVYGYTTNKGRKEITICALPIRLSISKLIQATPGQSHRTFGAVKGSQWPVRAIRRFMLYDVFLHELGHLQVIDAKAKNVNRKFASETKAQEFADYWRGKLWSKSFDHPDPVHNRPPKREIDGLEHWVEAHLAYRRGMELKQKNKRREAIEYFEEAISLYSDHSLALESLGMCVFSTCTGSDDTKSLRKAEKLFKRALSIDPLLPDGNLILAMTYAFLNDQKSSEKYFKKSVKIDPYSLRVLSKYASSLDDWDRNDESEVIFKKILKKEPDSVLILRDYSLMLIGRRENDGKDLDNAIRMLKKANKILPDNYLTNYYLAMGYMYIDGKQDEAIQYVRAALELKPNHRNSKRLLNDLLKK